MCNKITFVKLDGHDVQGLNQVAPFNLKFSTLSVHPLLVQFLKKKQTKNKKKKPNDIQYLIQGRQALTTAVANKGKDRKAHYSPLPLL